MTRNASCVFHFDRGFHNLYWVWTAGLKLACTRLGPAPDYKTAGILLGCFFGLDNNQYWKKKIASMSHSVSDYCPATVRSAAAKY